MVRERRTVFETEKPVQQRLEAARLQPLLFEVIDGGQSERQ